MLVILPCIVYVFFRCFSAIGFVILLVLLYCWLVLVLRAWVLKILPVWVPVCMGCASILCVLVHISGFCYVARVCVCVCLLIPCFDLFLCLRFALWMFLKEWLEDIAEKEMDIGEWQWTLVGDWAGDASLSLDYV